MYNVNDVIATQLNALRDKKGTIAIDDLSGILENIAGMLNNNSSLDVILRDEIIKIAHHIETTKSEIIALGPEIASNKDLKTATVQLDAVLKATEDAAHHIMDAADEMQSVIAAATVEQAVKDKVTELTARIYEACNFQDLTGQRINKVIHALEFIESRIGRLVALFSTTEAATLEEHSKAASTRTDAHLLNGPQLPGSQPSQADIDALFGASNSP